MECTTSKLTSNVNKRDHFNSGLRCQRNCDVRGIARVRAVYFPGGGAFDLLPKFSQLRRQKNSELTQQDGRGKKTANLV